MKSWSRKSALACAAISLFAGLLRAQPKPTIVLPDPRDAAAWQKWTAEIGWQVIAPAIDPHTDADSRALALADAVHAAIENSSADPAHIYLGGRGEDAALVFYIVSRVPDLWAAALALGGSPKPALASGRIFAANFSATPVLWVSEGAGDSDIAARLKSAGLNIAWRDAKSISIGQCFEALAHFARSEFPPLADCETNTVKFPRCFWIDAAKFDPAEHNGALASTRLIDGSGASLDLGGFGYRLTDPGPGVLISYLPENYIGPLKIGDRIVELDGQPLADARDFDARLNKITAERPSVILVARGKERLRFDTLIVLPRPGAFVTARVQGRYDAATKTLRILSRSISEMRVTLPPEWAPVALEWDGLAIQTLDKPGCYLLSIDQEFLNAAPCPK